MSSQPPYGQGSSQQPPAGPPGQGPGGPPETPSGPPGPAGPPPDGPPPGGAEGPPPPGGQPPSGGTGGPPQSGPGEPQPPGKSKTPLVIGVIAGVIVLAVIAALLYFLVFNGDDGTAGEAGDDYCSLLEENQAAFDQFSTGNFDPNELESAVSTLHELRQAAPGEIEDEWAQLDDPLQELQGVLDETGTTWEDIDQAQSPEDVDPAVAEAVQTFFSEVQGIDQDAIFQTINDHAKDECNLDLQDEGSEN